MDMKFLLPQQIGMTKTKPSRTSFPTSLHIRTSQNLQQSSCKKKDEKKARDTILQPMVERIVREENEVKNQQNTKKKSTRSIIREVVNDTISLLPWLNENMLQCRVRRYKKKVHEKLSTNPEMHDTNEVHTDRQSMQRPPPTSPICHMTPTTTTSIPTNVTERSKGSTGAAKRSRTVFEAAATNEVCARYHQKREEAAAKKRRVKNGMLDSIISEVKKERNLPSTFTVSRNTVSRRIRTGNITVPIYHQPGLLCPISTIVPSSALQEGTDEDKHAAADSEILVQQEDMKMIVSETSSGNPKDGVVSEEI